MDGIRHSLHDNNSRFVELIDNPLWRNTDRANEESGSAVDNNINKLAELSVRVILVGLSRVTSNLRDEEIHTERGLLVLEMALELIN